MKKEYKVLIGVIIPILFVIPLLFLNEQNSSTIPIKNEAIEQIVETKEIITTTKTDDINKIETEEDTQIDNITADNEANDNLTTDNKTTPEIKTNSNTEIFEGEIIFSITKSTTQLTNKDVILTINTDSNNLISFNNQEYTSNKTFTINTNGIYNIKVKGITNKINEENITINNIDKTKPILNYTKSTTEITTNPVTITLNGNDNVSLPTNKYSYNYGDFTSNNTYTFNTNTISFSLRVIDSAGNIAEEFITINNIQVSLKSQNQQTIAEIRNTYGFDIEYGSDTYFWYAGMPSTILTDENKVSVALTNLKKTLNLFPTGFFYMFQGRNGYSVLLMDDIPGDVAGVATSEMPGSNQLVLDVNAGFLGRTFYHETFHLIDYMLDYMYYGRDDHPFKDWNKLNSPTFTYSGIDYDDNSLTIYDSSISNTEIKFITSYSKKSEREDRAELFADLMFRPYRQYYMTNDYGIYQKAKYLTSVLNSIWTNNSGAGWNRWVN